MRQISISAWCIIHYMPPRTLNLSGADPYADPAMLSFIRSAGASENLARLAVANQKSKINRKIAEAGPNYQEALAQGLQGIADTAETRGMYRSGQRLKDQNDFQVKAARGQSSYLQDLQDRLGDADIELATNIARLQRERDEQELQSRYNVARQVSGL